MIFILKPKHWLLLLTGGNVCWKACSKKPWYLKEPGMSSGRSLCTRSLASLSSLTNSARKCRWIRFQTILPWFKRQSRQTYLEKIYHWLLVVCVAVFFVILALNTPLATAADDLPLMKLNFLQTRKRCKRPIAKRTPGIHPGLFQISRLFRARFSADVSPGQEEQPMFWFKDNVI